MSAIQGAVDQITEEKKHVFVLKFNGDVTASQVRAAKMGTCDRGLLNDD